jgi:hypothetical protein
MKNFVSRYAILITDNNIMNSLKKFSEILKQNFKTQAEISQKFDPSGKGEVYVDSFSRRLDDLGEFNDNEMLVLSFIPVDPSESNDLSLMNTTRYFF